MAVSGKHVPHEGHHHPRVYAVEGVKAGERVKIVKTSDGVDLTHNFMPIAPADDTIVVHMHVSDVFHANGESHRSLPFLVTTG
jgi:hypothetical protein